MDVKIYPNPNDGHFVIAVDKASVGEISYSIYDITGKQVETRSLDSDRQSETAIDISKFPSGTYIVNVKADNQEFIKKIIKN
ncbi:hypothetical protein D9M72_566800 [compost metagenome]